MILRAVGGLLRVVTQPDHAAFAADVLSLLRLPELVTHPRRDALLRAVRLHDNGWQELDAAPVVDAATGRPLGFLELPEALRLEVWRRGTARYRDSEPYLALLVGEHARHLFAGRRHSAGWSDLLQEIEEARPELLDRAALEAAELEADYTFLDLADGLSLLVCNGWREALVRRGLRAEMAGAAAGGVDEVHLHPFVLAGATTFALSCRHVLHRRYESDGDLAVTLAQARWETVRVRVAPASAD